MTLVVKDNSLINASYTLGLVEQRLILLAIIGSRETGKGVDTETFLEIHAQQYANHFNIDVKNTYQMLSDAVLTLFNRQVTYMTVDKKRNKPEKRVVRWVSGISYVEGAGIVKIRFAPEVVPLITRLEQNFTSYELIQIANLNIYATRLYELLICWRSTGKVPTLEINEFRSKIGLLEHEYKLMHNFKNRVLEPAIKQINEHTDITVSYEQHKSGRTITGFSFTFKQKNPHQVPSGSLNGKNVIDVPTSLTEKQIMFFANKLAYDDIFASQYAEVGEEYPELEKRLIEKLANKNFVKKVLMDLKRVGFQ